MSRLRGVTVVGWRQWGDKGKLMLPEALHVPRALFIPLFAVFLVAVLAGLARFTVR